MRQPVSSADERQPPEPVVLRQRTEPFFFARLEPAFALELPQLVKAPSGILGHVLPFERPVEERLQPAEAPVRRDDAASVRLVRVALRIRDCRAASE